MHVHVYGCNTVWVHTWRIFVVAWTHAYMPIYQQLNQLIYIYIYIYIYHHIYIYIERDRYICICISLSLSMYIHICICICLLIHPSVYPSVQFPLVIPVSHPPSLSISLCSSSSAFLLKQTHKRKQTATSTTILLSSQTVHKNTHTHTTHTIHTHTLWTHLFTHTHTVLKHTHTTHTHTLYTHTHY